MQYISKKILDIFRSIKAEKIIMNDPKVINDGLISFKVPVQYFWWNESDPFIPRYW